MCHRPHATITSQRPLFDYSRKTPRAFRVDRSARCGNLAQSIALLVRRQSRAFADP